MVKKISMLMMVAMVLSGCSLFYLSQKTTVESNNSFENNYSHLKEYSQMTSIPISWNQTVPIPDTTLQIELPIGWEIIEDVDMKYSNSSSLEIGDATHQIVIFAEPADSFNNDYNAYRELVSMMDYANVSLSGDYVETKVGSRTIYTRKGTATNEGLNYVFYYYIVEEGNTYMQFNGIAYASDEENLKNSIEEIIKSIGSVQE